MTEFSPIEPAPEKKTASDLVQDLKAAWKDKDYARTIDLGRALLKLEPQNTLGSIYLCRAAAESDLWSETASTALAIVQSSPVDAFRAARKLADAGHLQEASQIFCALDYNEDWFDAPMADRAWKQGITMLKLGDEAMTEGDAELAKAAWIAGTRLAPRSRILSSRVRELAENAKEEARQVDREQNPAAYIEAWNDVLRLDPTNLSAANKVALALGRGPDKAATLDAWLKVLEIDPANEKAIEKVRDLAGRENLEDRVIHALRALGRDETDPLIRDLVVERDQRAAKAQELALKSQLKIALLRARAVNRETEPERFLSAWREVIVLDPKHGLAARKVVSIARQLGDDAALVEGLVVLVEIDPGDAENVARLISAGLNRHQEQKTLDCLAALGQADLSEPKIEKLFTRVHRMCKDALRAGDFTHALSYFQTLERVNGEHPLLEPLRPDLARRAATSAKTAEREGNLAGAVQLAEAVLAIDPNLPAAIGVVARDMLRGKRFRDVIALCTPKIQPHEEWDPIRKVVEKAAMKLPA
jgi:tetratricopeptide (TPR) repeat protein